MNGHVVQVLSWRLNEAFLVTLPILRKNVNFIKKKTFLLLFSTLVYIPLLYIYFNMSYTFKDFEKLQRCTFIVVNIQA